MPSTVFGLLIAAMKPREIAGPSSPMCRCTVRRIRNDRLLELVLLCEEEAIHRSDANPA
jgi:hypothetical protein